MPNVPPASVYPEPFLADPHAEVLKCSVIKPWLDYIAKIQQAQEDDPEFLKNAGGNIETFIHNEFFSSDPSPKKIIVEAIQAARVATGVQAVQYLHNKLKPACGELKRELLKHGSWTSTDTENFNKCLPGNVLRMFIVELQINPRNSSGLVIPTPLGNFILKPYYILVLRRDYETFLYLRITSKQGKGPTELTRAQRKKHGSINVKGDMNKVPRDEDYPDEYLLETFGLERINRNFKLSGDSMIRFDPQSANSTTMLAEVGAYASFRDMKTLCRRAGVVLYDKDLEDLDATMGEHIKEMEKVSWSLPELDPLRFPNYNTPDPVASLNASTAPTPPTPSVPKSVEEWRIFYQNLPESERKNAMEAAMNRQGAGQPSRGEESETPSIQHEQAPSSPSESSTADETAPKDSGLDSRSLSPGSMNSAVSLLPTESPDSQTGEPRVTIASLQAVNLKSKRKRTPSQDGGSGTHKKAKQDGLTTPSSNLETDIPSAAASTKPIKHCNATKDLEDFALTDVSAQAGAEDDRH